MVREYKVFLSWEICVEVVVVVYMRYVVSGDIYGVGENIERYMFIF